VCVHDVESIAPPTAPAWSAENDSGRTRFAGIFEPGNGPGQWQPTSRPPDPLRPPGVVVLDWHRPVKISSRTSTRLRYGSLGSRARCWRLLHRYGHRAPALAGPVTWRSRDCPFSPPRKRSGASPRPGPSGCRPGRFGRYVALPSAGSACHYCRGDGRRAVPIANLQKRASRLCRPVRRAPGRAHLVLDVDQLRRREFLSPAWASAGSPTNHPAHEGMASATASPDPAREARHDRRSALCRYRLIGGQAP